MQCTDCIRRRCVGCRRAVPERGVLSVLPPFDSAAAPAAVISLLNRKFIGNTPCYGTSGETAPGNASITRRQPLEQGNCSGMRWDREKKRYSTAFLFVGRSNFPSRVMQRQQEGNCRKQGRSELCFLVLFVRGSQFFHRCRQRIEAAFQFRILSYLRFERFNLLLLVVHLCIKRFDGLDSDGNHADIVD